MSDNKQQVPEVISTYLEAANLNNEVLFISAFSEDATVKDEGKIHRGIEKIVKWKKKLEEQFDLTYKLLDFSVENEKIKATIQCTGNFQGSPCDFQYDFLLENDKIKEMRISG